MTVARLPVSRRLVALAAAVGLTALAAAPAPADAAGPRRVVALTPFTANVLAELGVRPVAIGNPPAGQQFLSSRLNGVPRLRLTHPHGPNLEQLLAVRPDLVLSSPTWRSGTARIQQRRIRVLDGVDPQRLATVPIGVQQIANAVGRSRHGKQIAARMNREIQGSLRGIEKRPRVLVVMGLARYTIAFRAGTWAGDVVRQAGGRLLTDGLKPLAPTGPATAVANLSNEEVVKRNPDVIIVIPHGRAQDIPSIAAYYRNFKPWRTTKAARAGRIYVPTDDQLLQASSNPARVIKMVRQQYLKNW